MIGLLLQIVGALFVGLAVLGSLGVIDMRVCISSAGGCNAPAPVGSAGRMRA
ncbi:hypothetical protein [Caballeronia temeraria]|nr:hypothetical protein [Caballeronia temeraria]